MGNKTLIRLIAALAVVGVLALIVHYTGTGKLERGQRDQEIDRKLVIEGMSAAEIQKVRITGVGTELNFVRGDEGWKVVERENYPADSKAIDRLLVDAGRLKIRHQPSLSAASLGSVQLLDPVREGASVDDSAMVLTFVGEDGKEKGQLWLGKVHEIDSGRPGMFGTSSEDVGRFVRSGDSETVFLVEKTFADIKTDPPEWLDDSFFTVSQVKSVKRDSGKPEEDWSLVRDGADGEFSFAKPKAGEELDIGKVGTMKNAFASPRFEDVLTGEFAKEKPEAITFTVETFEGFVYTVKVSEKAPTGELKLTVDATGKFEEKRKEGPEEDDDEKKRLDDAFAAELKAKKDNLADVKKLSERVFKTRSYFVDSINKKRSEILKEEGSGAAAGPGTGAGAGVPGALPNIPGFGGGIPGLPTGHPTVSPAPKPKPKPAPKPDAAPKADAKPKGEPKEATAAKPAEKPAATKPKPAADAKPEAAKPAEKAAAAEAKPDASN